MTQKKDRQKSKQGHDIPIPKRGDVFKVFKKAATHQEKSKRPRSPKK